MVFVPPDRTARREAASRVVAVGVVALAALVCLVIAAFSDDSGPARIAVAHSSGARDAAAVAPTSSRPARTDSGPVRTAAQLRARFTAPARATQAGSTATSGSTGSIWHVHMTMSATKADCARRLAALGVRWRPVATASGGWAAPVRSADGTRLARLALRPVGHGVTAIVMSA